MKTQYSNNVLPHLILNVGAILAVAFMLFAYNAWAAPLSASDGTDIAGAIYNAGFELQSSRHQPNNKQVIILLSDGEQTVPGNPTGAGVWAKSEGIRIIAIGLGVTPGSTHESTLQTMASSLSDYHNAPTSTDLCAVYEEIATEVGCSGGAVYLPIGAHVKVGGENIAACYPDAKASG